MLHGIIFVSITLRVFSPSQLGIFSWLTEVGWSLENHQKCKMAHLHD